MQRVKETTYGHMGAKGSFKSKVNRNYILNNDATLSREKNNSDCQIIP